MNTTYIRFEPDDDHSWHFEVFDYEGFESTIQEIDTIFALEGRLVAFPHTFENRVIRQSNIRITSTVKVPSQLHGYWTQEIAKERPVAIPPGCV